jgi:hypothetical protein
VVSGGMKLRDLKIVFESRPCNAPTSKNYRRKDMNTLETIKEFGRSNAMSTAKKQHLYLAYLQLHLQNPGLHPDDYYEDGGYPGYGVLIVEAVRLNYTSLPDDFMYPCALFRLEETLEELRDYHEDMIVDDPEADVLHLDFIASINTIHYWLDDMKVTELCGIVGDLQKLYLYHASEHDSAEEEAEKPAGILKTVADMLNWILQQK